MSNRGETRSPSQRLVSALNRWAEEHDLEGGSEIVAERIIGKAIDTALAGNTTVLKTLLTLLLPRSETFINSSELAMAADLPAHEQMSRVWSLMITGKLSLETGKELLSAARIRHEIEDLQKYRDFAESLMTGEDPRQAAAALLGRSASPSPPRSCLPPRHTQTPPSQFPIGSNHNAQ